jgi:hypothetical protein
MISGCSVDLDALRGTGPVDATLPDAHANIPDTSIPDASIPDADATTPDATIPDAIVPDCGRPGMTCCPPLNDCVVGVCLRGVCSSFGGAFSEAPSCSRVCDNPNPLVAGCSCPPDFALERIDGLNGRGCGLLDTAPRNIGLCTAGGLSFGDYTGFWMSAEEDAECAAECLHPHPATADCACPDGTLTLAFGMDAPSSCSDHRPGTISFCLDRSYRTVSFAGAYRWDNLIRTDCGVINPLTGSCACPEDASEIELPVTRSGQIIPPITLCVQ